MNGYTFLHLCFFFFLPSLKVSTIKEKNLLVDLVFEGVLFVGRQTGSHKSCFSCKNGGKIFQM